MHEQSIEHALHLSSERDYRQRLSVVPEDPVTSAPEDLETGAEYERPNVLVKFLNDDMLQTAITSPYVPVRVLGVGAVVVGAHVAGLAESPIVRKAAQNIAVAALAGYGALRTAAEIAPKYAGELAETGLRNIQQ